MKRVVAFGSLIVVVALVVFFAVSRSHRNESQPLSVGISPYQDIATIEAMYPLKLEDKYGTRLQLRTMAWEDILPALASHGQTIDVGFASYTEFITRENSLNAGSSDPLVFIYPAYVFHGGAFVTFDPKVPILTQANIQNADEVKKFLSYRIGAPKSTLWEMMIFSLARRVGVPPSQLHLSDSPINDSLLATRHGSLDLAAAGLTQMTEAKKTGGSVALDMDVLQFADITGFVCRTSTLQNRRHDVENLLRIWYDTSNFVMSDIDHNSTAPLDYLNKNAATHYSLEEYKAALSQEFFPKSVSEANTEIVGANGRYSSARIGNDVLRYLQETHPNEPAPALPHFIDMR